MPKLNKTKAAEVAKAESDFAPVDEGRYLLQLRKVESKEGPNGFYWSWEFEIRRGPEDETEYNGRKIWDMTSLNEKALWRLKEVFEAFDAPTDTDTDELIGKVVAASIIQEEQTQGKGAGKMRNRIDAYHQLGEGESITEGDEEPF